LILENEIDVVFLDVSLRGENGFDLLPSLPEKTNVIFVTGFGHHAARAFEVNALDYILKPPHKTRVEEALSRLDSQKENASSNQLNIDDKLFLTGKDFARFVPVDTVLYIESMGDYSQVVDCDLEKYDVRRTLKAWVSMLPQRHFLRISRSVIVNLDSVIKAVPFGRGMYNFYMQGVSDPFLVSRQYTYAFLKSQK